MFYSPNALGHSDNYIPANPMQTPASIVPEWYLLPFYAILRSIPNKLLGVIAMFSSLLILLILPILDTGKSRNSFIQKQLFWVFVIDLLGLMYLGACHVEDPYIVIGQIATFIYFGYFLILPVVSTIENILINKFSRTNKNIN